MRIHPGGFRLILAGPKVARLLPFLQQKGFVAEAFVKGGEALNRMRQAPCHLLLLELECGDTMGVDLARGAKQEGITGAALLVDDPMKSGMIVSALARGVDSFVAIPPDETVFFDRIEGMLLAQWGLVVTQQQAQMTDELARLQARVAEVDASEAVREEATQGAFEALEVELAAEKRRVADLLRETAGLREQLTTMHLVTGAKTGHSDEGSAHNDEEVDFLLDDDPLPTMPTAKPGRTVTTPARTPGSMPDSDPLDDFDTFGITTGEPSPDFENASTMAIPADVAASLMASVKGGGAPKRGASDSTLPFMKAQSAPSVEELEDFVSEAGFGGSDDASTMAMSADVARSLLEAATISPEAGLTRSDVLDEFEHMPTSGKGFDAVDAIDDFDAPTMSIPHDVAQALINQRRAPPDAFDFEDEMTPAAGLGKAPAVPKSVGFVKNDDQTAPGGIDASAFDTGKRKPVTKGPALDSQLLRDLAGIPSAEDDEIVFVDDD